MKVAFQLLLLMMLPTLLGWILGPFVPHVSGAMQEFWTWQRERRLRYARVTAPASPNN